MRATRGIQTARAARQTKCGQQVAERTMREHAKPYGNARGVRRSVVVTMKRLRAANQPNHMLTRQNAKRINAHHGKRKRARYVTARGARRP